MVLLTNRVGRQLSRHILDDLTYRGFAPQGTHVGLLADLVSQDGVKQQDLAISGIKDKGTVARALAQLEGAGFVIRHRADDDRRAKTIHLTEAGLAFWRHIEGRVATVMPRLTQTIPPAKLATCLEVLSSLYDELSVESPILEPSNNG